MFFHKRRKHIPLIVGVLLVACTMQVHAGYSHKSTCDHYRALYPTSDAWYAVPKGPDGSICTAGKDAAGFCKCECTSYAAEKAGIASNDGLSDAHNWDDRAEELDIPVSNSVPAWGAVIQWNKNVHPAGKDGHVGYVEWVNFDKNSGTITGLDYTDWNGNNDHNGPGEHYISTSSSEFQNANFLYVNRPEVNHYQGSNGQASTCLDAFPTYGYALCWDHSGSSETCSNASRNYVVWDHEQCSGNPSSCPKKSVSKNLCPPQETYVGIGSTGRTNLLAYYSPSGNLMSWVSGTSFGGGSPSTPPIGTNPDPKSGPRADLYPDYDIKRNGGEISANCDDCSGKPVTVGENLEYKGAIKVANADATDWRREGLSSVDKVEGTFFYRIPGYQDSWQEFCTEKYSVEKLDKNATIQGTCYWSVPNVPGEGYILETAFCPDRDDIIWEEDETENRDKISDPIDDDDINCSRTERNYIKLPNYVPSGAVDVGSCDALSGWATDQNTSDPLRIHIYANGAFAGQPLANESRSGVGSHGFTWEVPSALKDGTAKNFTFYAVDVPDGTETSIGSVNLTCSLPYDLATIATWIDGDYTLDPEQEFTIQSVLQNNGSDLPDGSDTTVTSTLIHSDGAEYPMGSVTISASNLLSGWNADAVLNATAPSQEGTYTLRTCVTVNLQETDDTNNCLEENGPYITDPTPAGLSDDEEAAIWIINHPSWR